MPVYFGRAKKTSPGYGMILLHILNIFFAFLLYQSQTHFCDENSIIHIFIYILYEQ